jgi:pyruvate dehydrogenase E1 component alpha subunit
MASIWDLPVVFVLENNQYGVSTHISYSTRIEDLSLRARSYGISGVPVDGFDVLAVYEAMTDAVDRARRGDGPTLLVTESYRVDGHYAGEPEVYRTRDEVEAYRQKDPILRFRRYLLHEGSASEDELDGIHANARQEMLEAVRFAQESLQPDPATAMDYIYA